MAINTQQKAAPSAEDTLAKSRNILQETWIELKKTTWPTRQEAIRLTTVVLGVIVFLGIYMGLLDFLLTTIVERFSLIK